MIFADLHIHVGRSLDGKPVKITAAASLTLPNIIRTARDVKGLTLVGIVDAQAPGVQADFAALLQDKTLKELAGGGYAAGELAVLPGTEVELGLGGGNAHFLVFFPTLAQIEEYRGRLGRAVKNWQLSSQKAFVPVEAWLEAVQRSEGVWFPAHAFTPHKGIYGNCCRRLGEVLPAMPRALELGLSADRCMARSISELDGVHLLSNSDAHSLPKIAREYNVLKLREPSFHGFTDFLAGRSGEVIRNYGVMPEIGKYHRPYCLACEQVIRHSPPQFRCPSCGSNKIVPGVLDRLLTIADRDLPHEDSVYVYQVPLAQLPGIGPKTYQKLLGAFGTEMAILHEVPEADLLRVAGEQASSWILKSRRGELAAEAGGGGVYGRVRSVAAAEDWQARLEGDGLGKSV